MRVLITGGTGFVGSHTVAAVVRAGHTVLWPAGQKGPTRRSLRSGSRWKTSPRRRPDPASVQAVTAAAIH